MVNKQRSFISQKRNKRSIKRLKILTVLMLSSMFLLFLFAAMNIYVIGIHMMITNKITLCQIDEINQLQLKQKTNTDIIIEFYNCVENIKERNNPIYKYYTRIILEGGV